MNRYFRVEPATYEQVRLSLDAAWGHGLNAGTRTCVDPADVAPRDSASRVLLSVRAEFCEYEAVAAMLPQLLASGAVEEIDEATYRAAIPTA